MDLKGRSFLKLLDYSPEELSVLLDQAAVLKAQKQAGIAHRMHEGKSLALIFEKTSTRTRCAFEVAAAELGMHTVVLDPKTSQMGKKESLPDTARVLGRMFDGIEYRGYGQDRVELLAKYAGVPVFNGLTDQAHPTQILADLLTVREHCGRLAGVKLTYLGDARNNVASSLMVGCAMMGLHFTACAPEAYLPDPALAALCRSLAAENGGSVRLESDPATAVSGADILYTDVWLSMGEPEENWDRRVRDLLPYRVNSSLMERAGEQCRFLHCLPACHNTDTEIGRTVYERCGITCMEVTDEVFESPASLVFDQAENRLHTIKALLAALI